MNPIELIERVRVVSPTAANALFGRLIPQLIPLADGLDVHVREVTDERCELWMPLRKRSRDQVGGVYLGAQLTLADLTVAIALQRRFPPHQFRAWIRRVEADFVSEVHGTLRCVCEPPLALLAALERAVPRPANVEAWFPLRLLDEQGTLATDARFLVRLEPADLGAHLPADAVAPKQS